MHADDFDAVILDMDGVVTNTATLHARAWKRTFDEYLDRRRQRDGEEHRPFDVEADYFAHVDGVPRYDGVRRFLESRGIELPQGDPEDDPAEETVCGLGNRKNELFQELLERDGADVFPDAIEKLDEWKRLGLKLAVVSSSKNCKKVLERVGLLDRFQVRVDGLDVQARGLPGKPDPAMFLEAAKQLGVEPRRAAVLEDATAGVAAGVAGGFGLVVGVARNQDAEALRREGAQVVVRDLSEPILHAHEETP